MKVKPHQTFRLMGLFYIKIHGGFVMELVRVQDSDYQKTYELYMSFPENENGYMNNVYGYSYEQFLEWIEKKRNRHEPD